ncbi:hypothetical protein TNCV_4408931 [Trichonephila clavipes]|nr:hypothetical protein TNCV_4408931 [Trichonephila clavipes]
MKVRQEYAERTRDRLPVPSNAREINYYDSGGLMVWCPTFRASKNKGLSHSSPSCSMVNHLLPKKTVTHLRMRDELRQTFHSLPPTVARHYSRHHVR